MKRRILTVIIALILVVGLVGVYLYSKPTPDIVRDKPVWVLSAKELVTAFEQDSAAGRKKYMDKIVEVSGTVKSIDTSGAVVLGEEGTASEVVAGFDRRHLQDYKKLTIGSVAILQGICSGYSTSGGGDPTDLLANLGTTVQIRSAGVKSK